MVKRWYCTIRGTNQYLTIRGDTCLSAGRPIREIEQRALTDDLAVPIALSEEDGGRRIPVGDGLDVHGACVSHRAHKLNGYYAIYMATFSEPNKDEYARNQILKEIPKGKLRLGEWRADKSRFCYCRYSPSHSLFRRPITAVDRLDASLPSKAESASWKSPAEIPRR